MVTRQGLRLLALAAVAVVAISGCGTSATSPGSPTSAGESWTQQEIRDRIGAFGLSEMPPDQQDAVADGIVTWAEIEQATGRVEACYEEQMPGHDMSFTKHEFDPESGQPTQLLARIAHGSDASDSQIRKVQSTCEKQFSLPLTFLYIEMNTDWAKNEQWIAEHPPEPGGQWMENGTPVPAPAG